MNRQAFVSSLIAAASGAALFAGAAAAGELTVHIDGVEARGGTLYVSIQTEAQFMQSEGVDGRMVAEPEAGAHSFTFDLPEGRYSISVWHDDNANAQFDRREDGFPLDGWAMINAAQFEGAPTFAEASVAVGPDGASVRERIIYGR